MLFVEAQDYLDSFLDYEKDPTQVYNDLKLERVKELLDRLGNPQEKFKCIQIAGTKGKGSTCAMLFSILKSAKYKVGLYTSPHLISFRERFRISYLNEISEAKERLIKEGEVCKLLEEIKSHTDGIEGLTFFEICTAMALKFFANTEAEFVILETGIGGRLDATSVVDPIACGFTSISLDHTNLLGNSLEKIAQEKAGIIKSNALVVTAPQPPQALKVIADACKKNHTRLYEAGKDFICDPIGQDLNGSIFDLRGIFYVYESLHLSLIGQHQLINASVALGIIQLLKLHDTVVSILAIKEGLENVRWPGRMQIVHKRPFLILDGAQNAESANALRLAINMLLIPNKSVLILGVSKGKDVAGICSNLCRQRSLVIVTQANNPRSLDVDTLEATVTKYHKNVKKTENVKQALELAAENVGQDDLIIVTGSLYLIGEALKASRTLKFKK
ncbi:MAG: bifunctional folylpolyglutamate synthase/dihydrofolate synthase [PVC group bacterium]|nr:bifunctional folylpolyglutamate synthase/dihydrofolate synthase [PVC group bacterium]